MDWVEKIERRGLTEAQLFDLSSKEIGPIKLLATS